MGRVPGMLVGRVCSGEGVQWGGYVVGKVCSGEDVQWRG